MQKILDDYFLSNDEIAAAVHLKTLQQPLQHHELIFEIIIRAIDAGSEKQNNLRKLMNYLLHEKVVSIEQFQKVGLMQECY